MQARVTPISIPRLVEASRAPGVTPSDLARLHHRLGANDRAGTYLELYRLTGQPFWLMDAQITSYSGVWGGGALAANFLVKREHAAAYRVALDQFSWSIANNMLRLVGQSVHAGQRGYVHPGMLLYHGDGDIWRANGLGEHFPGSGLFLSDSSEFGLENVPKGFSLGTLISARAMITTGGQYGKRPSEFAGNSCYRVVTSEGRFRTVFDQRSGKVEVFFDARTTAGVFGQIVDRPLTRNDADWHERALRWEFMQANQDDVQSFRPATVSAYAAPPARQRGSACERMGANSGCNVEIERAKQNRRLLGLPVEPTLPGRYVSAGLFAD